MIYDGLPNSAFVVGTNELGEGYAHVVQVVLVKKKLEMIILLQACGLLL